MEARRYLITLVHGTFARKKKSRPWTLAGSDFRSILREKLAPATVEFSTFEWDGRNSHSSRIRAGERLAKQLLDELPKSRDDRRVLIGHSHGGNVLMYAIKALSREGRECLVDGVVCLATPHLTVSERHLRNSFVAIGALVGFFVASIYAVGITVPAFNAGREIGGVFAVVFMIGFFLVFLLPIWLFGGPIHETVKRAAERKAAQLTTYSIDAQPILSLKVAGDEAFGLLSVQQFLSVFVHPIWKGGTKAVFRLWFGVILAMAAAAFIIELVNLIPMIPDVHIGPLLEQSFELIGRTGALMLFALTLILGVVLVSPMLFRAHPLGFGWESLLMRSGLSIGVDEVPQQHTRCDQRTFLLSDIEEDLERPEFAKWRACRLKRGLLHSYVYVNPAILGHIADWIKKHV